jgi:hypothetical protein
MPPAVSGFEMMLDNDAGGTIVQLYFVNWRIKGYNNAIIHEHHQSPV